jgi:hypothetical protein
MPAIAHIGIGFAAKKIASHVNVVLLIIAAEFIEIIFMALWAIGIEHPPTIASPPFSPYSHSILMGLAWSLFAGLLTFLFSKNRKLSWIIGILVLSHTVLDFIASPKSAFYPNDTGMPWLFDYSRTYGLGLWSNGLVAGIGEIGILVLGITIYLITVRKIRKERSRILKFR